MAPNLTAIAEGPEVVGEIIAIPVDQIDVGDRLRSIDTEWAHALGRIMLVEGQRTPIEVCRLPGKRRWTLVAGAHRLAAAQTYLDIGPIRAIVVTADAIDRKMREISENLWRKGLDPLDRATFVAEMHQLLRAKAGLAEDASAQSIAANARWKKEVKAAAEDASVTMTDAYGFTGQIAERIGLSKSAIERDLTLRRLRMPVIANLAGHPILRNATQLRALANLDYGKQASAADLIQKGHAKSVAEAIAILEQKPKASPDSKRLSAFLGSFARMGGAEKKGALAQLVENLSPSMRRELRELLTEVTPNDQN